MAIDFGYDASGNGNNWTANNLSSTAGAGNDSLTDTPTSYGTDTGVGGEVRGNYCTLNPLANSSVTTLTNGNLSFSSSGSTASSYWTRSTIAVSSGKWYWEVTPTDVGAGPNYHLGIQSSDVSALVGGITGEILNGYGYYASGNKLSGTTYSAYGSSFTNNDVIGVALDMDAGTITFYKNNVSQGQAFSGITGTFSPLSMFYTGGTARTSAGDFNFGQRAFAYTAPSGFKALCTQNLPTPTIGATSTTQANRYMDIKLYTGNGGQQTQTGLNFKPDFIWVKSRSNAYDNGLANAVTGTGKYLVSNSTAAEVTDASGSIIAFNASGFGQGGSNPFGANAATYAAWCWRASNAAGVTNTAGTITSTVSANTTSGFSIVTYTGNFTASQTVGHGLSTAPVFIIAKRRDSTSDWGCIHPSLAATQIIRFNLTGAAETNDWFANTRPTSSVFYVGQNSNTNPSGGTMVAYCFAPVAGYSAFGSYTGNGSTDGPFVYTGFRPRYVLIKNSSATADWILVDTVRQTYNVVGNYFRPNTSNAEQSSGLIDIVSNGFKIRTDSSSVTLNALNTYIYAAFAESPFKYSLAR